MAKFVRKRSEKAGLPPGALVYVGEDRTAAVGIAIIDYDADHVEHRAVTEPDDCLPYLDRPTVTWVNVDGIHNAQVVEMLGERFDLHPLVLEDIMSTSQRAKAEDYEGYIYVVTRMLTYNEEKHEVDAEQVSLILGKNSVLSFQERPGDVFDALRERIRSGKGRVRQMGADFLLYALLDAIVDGYFAVLEKLGDRIDDLEEMLRSDAQPEILREIHALKKDMIFMRKAVWPLRETIGYLQREEGSLISPATDIFLRDVHDHTIRVIETIESLRDLAGGMVDTYLSTVSNRMNEVMKVLTVIATLFIPLTFIVGVYGMNFAYLPEKDWRWGYPAVWAVMIAVVLVMLGYFRRRKWI